MRPRIAETERFQCTAFGKRDKRRCRLERHPGEKTCEVHRRYYETWHDTHRLFDLHYIGIRERRELEFQIEGGYVSIPHSWIVQLRSTGERAWYPFLLTHVDFPPTLNISCFHELMFQEFFYKVLWSEEDFMRRHVRDVESCNQAMYLILQYAMIMCHGGLYSYFDLVETYLRRLDWWPIAFSTSYMDLCESLHTQFQQTFSVSYAFDDPNNQLVGYMKKFHRHLGRALRKRCEVYKEELIAAAWAPKRIQRWLDMGYDLDLLERL